MVRNMKLVNREKTTFRSLEETTEQYCSRCGEKTVLRLGIRGIWTAILGIPLFRRSWSCEAECIHCGHRFVMTKEWYRKFQKEQYEARKAENPFFDGTRALIRKQSKRNKIALALAIVIIMSRLIAFGGHCIKAYQEAAVYPTYYLAEKQLEVEVPAAWTYLEQVSEDGRSFVFWTGREEESVIVSWYDNPEDWQITDDNLDRVFAEVQQYYQETLDTYYSADNMKRTEQEDRIVYTDKVAVLYQEKIYFLYYGIVKFKGEEGIVSIAYMGKQIGPSTERELESLIYRRINRRSIDNPEVI